MMNVYFSGSPNEVHALPCDWNFDHSKCIGISQCPRRIHAGLSTLHGVNCSFMESGTEPLFRSAFQTFHNTQLSGNFKLQGLIKRLRLGMRPRKNRRKSRCAKIHNFADLVVGRLKQKLRKEKSSREINYFQRNLES